MSTILISAWSMRNFKLGTELTLTLRVDSHLILWLNAHMHVLKSPE